jgi:hypothetical protein
VKAYLYNQFDVEGGVLVIPDHSDIMRVLSRLVLSKSKLRDYRIGDSKKQSEAVVIKLSEFFFTKYGSSLTATNAGIFQMYLEAQIKMRLFDWIDAVMAVNEGMERKKAIHMAMERFGFDEDNFPYQTLKKSEYRRRLCEVA